MIQQQQQQQSESLKLWGFFGPGRLGGAERDRARKSQVPRLWTPRSRATDPAQGPNVRQVYTQGPCVPRSREHEKRPVARREKRADAEKRK